MGLEQSTLGKIILSCGSIAFVYYSIWLLSAPFVEDDSILAHAFPAKHLASALPIILGSALCCLIVFNVGWSLVGAHPVFQAHKHRVVNGKVA